MTDNSENTAGRRKTLLAFVLIALLASMAYLNTLENEFVFDDVKIIRDNTTIRSLSTAPEIFANMFVYHPLKGQGTKIDPSYRPIRYLSYAVDYQFTGLDPTGYHVSNIIYHIIASFLVFLLLKRLTGSFGASLGISLVFVLHPVHTESVAYLTGRKDVLCTIFYLLAFLAFLKYREKPALAQAILLPVFFALAFMAKEMAITLPAVMLLYDFGVWLREGKGGFGRFVKSEFSRRSLAIYLPVAVLAFFFAGTALFLKNPGGMGDEYIGRWGGSLYISTLTMLHGIAHYVRLLFVPLGLSADYSYDAFPVSRSLFTPITTLLSLWLVAGLLALGVVLFLKRKFLTGFAVLFFFVSLLPVMQFVPLPERIAERFLYLPSVGLMLLGTLLLARLMRKGGAARSAGVALLVLILIVFFGMTVSRNADWKNPLTLHRSVIELYPDCARSRLAVAEAFAMKAASEKATSPAVAENDYLSAIHHFGEVLRTLPEDTWQGWRRGYALNALMGRGIACAAVGKYEKAVGDLEKVLSEHDVFGSEIATNSDYLHVHFNLGEAYHAAGKYDKAISEFDKTLQMAKEKDARDYLVKAGFKKALALAGKGKLGEAIPVLVEAGSRAQGTIEEITLRYHIGLFQLDLKKNEEALKSFEKVIELCVRYEKSPESFGVADPKSVVFGVDKTKSQSYYMMAQAYDRLGKLRHAVKALEKTVEIRPGFLAARYSLGDFYFKFGKLDDAERQFRLVLKDAPGHEQSKQGLFLVEDRRRTLEKRKQPSPQKVFLLHQAAVRDYGTGELDKAADKLLEALQEYGKLESPDENTRLVVSKVRLLLGKISFDRQKFGEASSHLQEVIKLVSAMDDDKAGNPLGEAYYWLGRTLESKGEEGPVRSFLEKSIPLLRNAAGKSASGLEAAELLIHSAGANNTLEKYDEEFADFSKAAEIFPEYPRIDFLAAQSALRSKKPSEAAKFFSRSIKKNSKVTESRYNLGCLLLQAGKHTEAVVQFQEALKTTRAPYYLSACNYCLGEAFYAQGLYPLAAFAWQEYLKYEKDSERKKAVEKRLAEDENLKE